MKIIITFFIVCTVSLFSQNGNFRVDDGSTIKGFYNGLANYEESVLVKPNGPGTIKKVYIYLAGTTANKDTIWITQDPTDGYLPGSLYCHYISAFDGYVIDYKGVAGWFAIDVSNLNIKTGGINGIWIQHVIKPNGPFFVIDNEQDKNNYTSFLNDVYKPNPNFYNIRGSIVSICQGDYLAGVDIEYDYPKEKISAPPPFPVLNDVTTSAKLLNTSGGVIASEMVSVADWNNDGWDDIAIKSNFFQNNGDGTFTNVSAKITAPNNGTIWADLDNDGNLDFFASNGWKNDRIYWGNSDGTFTENTDEIIKQDAPTVSPLLLDFDRDGLIDIYVAYGRKEVSGQETYYADKLFKNLGGRKFQDVTQQAGITAENISPYDCWGASVTDYNSDGLPDIFVATYRLAPDLLYKNNGNGTFTEVGVATGARGAQTYYPNYFGHGMGSDWADIDNDGDLDLCVGNLAHWDERALSSNPSLILANQGPPNYNFSDFTKISGLKFFEMNAGTVWADLNLDGYQDLWHCQYAYEAKGVSRDKFSRVYINKGKILNNKFEDKTWDFGSYIHGAWSPVRIDYDNDGDMDLLIGSSNENVKLFENNIKKEGNWISLKLVGSPANKVNSQAYGSWVTVDVNGTKYYRALPGSVLNARASQSSNELNFGLGDINPLIKVKVEVKFSDGKLLNFSDLSINRKYLINYDGMIVPQPISRINLVSPLNNSTQKTNKILFKWNLITGHSSYTLQISDKQDFSSNVANHENLTENKFIINLEPKKTYYWRVKGISDDYTTMWSPVWSFNKLETPQKPNAPQLISPANNSINIPINNLELIWSKIIGAFAYELLLSEYEDFHEVIYTSSASGNSEINSTLITKLLKKNTKYYWKIRVAWEYVPGLEDDSQWSDWSEIWAFTTITPESKPDAPKLISPINNEVDVSLMPTLNWSLVQGGIFAEIYLSTSQDFSSGVYEFSRLMQTEVTTYQIPSMAELTKNTKYYWRVRLAYEKKDNNETNWGDWSKVWSFTTGDPSSVEESISGFTLEEPSPNPANNYVDISFNLENEAEVSLDIYKANGEFVQNVINSETKIGLCKYRLNTETFPQGAYLYTIKVNGKSTTKKFIVLR